MDVKSVLKVILERYAQKSVMSPLRTRLTKLLYLTELEYFRRTGRRLTSLDWKFHHFGPYASALIPYIGEPDSTTPDNFLADMLSKLQGEATPPDYDLQSAAANVVHQWWDTDLNALLDHVYFENEPMQAASRGDLLDFSTVQRESPKPLSVQLDQKKIKELRRRLRERSAAYSDTRRAAIAPDDLFSNLREWDSDRSLDPGPGQCYIDPRKLNKNE